MRLLLWLLLQALHRHRGSLYACPKARVRA